MKRVFVVGLGSSGKDHLRKRFEKLGYKFAIHYTTRPMRVGEVDGRDYYFISEKDFIEKVEKDDMIEYSIHNNWYYGLSKVEYENKDLFILSPLSFNKYSSEIKLNVLKIFLDISEDIRRKRLSKRNDADSVDRRLFTDREDLKKINMSEFDIVIKNEDF